MKLYVLCFGSLGSVTKESSKIIRKIYNNRTKQNVPYLLLLVLIISGEIELTLSWRRPLSYRNQSIDSKLEATGVVLGTSLDSVQILNPFQVAASLTLAASSNYIQKQPSRGVLKKRCSESMKQIYRRTPMLKCDFNKGEHPCRSEISIKLLCNFIEIALRHVCSPVNLLQYFQNTFSEEYLWMAASVHSKLKWINRIWRLLTY